MKKVIRLVDESFMEGVFSAIRMGIPMVIPSESGYLFAAEAINAHAIHRIQNIRGDDEFTSYALLVESIEQIRGYAEEITSEMEKILRDIWPGMLTAHLAKKNPKWDSGDQGFLPMFYTRSTNFKEVKEILKVVGPLVVASASSTGWPPLSSTESILESFGSQVGVILDAGILIPGKKTTVIESLPGAINVMRKGDVRMKDLQNNFPEIKFIDESQVTKEVIVEVEAK
jgi:L-threonylcarbamoyladenylate synthase